MTNQQNLIDFQAVQSVAQAAKEQIESINFIWHSAQACHGNYMCIRDYIKGVFDSLDNEQSEKYIGVLEWSFTQEIVESCLSGNLVINIDSVLIRFFSHGDIKALIGGLR